MADSPYSLWIDAFIDRIEESLKGFVAECPSYDDIANSISMQDGFADISTSIAFRVAKKEKMNPDEIAAKIAGAISGMDNVESVSHEKGFVNVRLARSEFAKAVLGHALSEKERSVTSGIGNGKSVIVEYPSANPVHPLHIGQLRNALIGDFVSNVHELCMFKVEREDYIDDMGLQAAQADWGYMNLAEGGPGPDEKFDHWLGKLYVQVNKKIDEPGVKDSIASTLKQMEDHSTDTARVAREVSERCVAAHRQTLADYGIYHDVLIWEGNILREHLLDSAMKIISKSAAFYISTDSKYANCFVLDLDKISDLPEEFKGVKEKIKVLKRSDGTATYAVKDIAFHMWKFGLLPNLFSYKIFLKQRNGRPLYTTTDSGEKMDFGAVDRAVNIIDSRQGYEQSIVKVALDAIGKKDLSSALKHLSYGVVNLEGGMHLAGRKGTWVGNTADDLLEGAKVKAADLITARMKLTGEQKAEVARSVALSAIKFEFLRVSPEKNIIFSWDRALNFESNSGPYFQYMHARASRILGDYGKEAGSTAVDYTLLTGEREFALVKRIAMAQTVIEKACREYRPNVVTDYISELSAQFSKFYESVPILKAREQRERDARVALTAAFKHTLAAMLKALGIEPADVM